MKHVLFRIHRPDILITIFNTYFFGTGRKTYQRYAICLYFGIVY